MKDEKLDAIEARANAATAGPWSYRGGDWVDIYKPDGNILIYDKATHSRADAEFIAAARTDVPALIAEVRLLRSKLSEMVAIADRQAEKISILRANATHD